MDARLSKLIKQYQRRVAEAVAMLEQAGICRPATNIEWTANAAPGRGSLPSGFTYDKHGFGCAVDGPGWGVDFDFGEEGQIDGFDAWRLYDFARKRLSEFGFHAENEIEGAVRSAAEAGELRFSGYILYYVTETGRQAMMASAGENGIAADLPSSVRSVGSSPLNSRTLARLNAYAELRRPTLGNVERGIGSDRPAPAPAPPGVRRRRRVNLARALAEAVSPGRRRRL